MEDTVKNSLGTFPVNKFELFVDVKPDGNHWVYFVGYMGLVPVNQSVADVAFSINGQFERYSKSLETFFDRFTRIFKNLYPNDI